MNRVNYDAMSNAELREYFLKHRKDEAAFQAYLNRINQRPLRIIASLNDPDDLPEYNLYRGQVGTVVELLAGGAAFEVEFSDASGGLRLRSGRTYESIGLRPEQIMVLHFEPASPDSVPEMVSV